MTITAATPATLELDPESLDPDELSMPALMREVSLQRKPSWILVSLMNALEKKRQAAGLGWSRRWNKEGMRIFRTHTMDRLGDRDSLQSAVKFIEEHLEPGEGWQREFARDLISDPALLVFTFYHNHDSGDGRQFEGLTLSFGRKVVGDATRRDRLDIVLEDARQQGSVDGVIDRVRIFVCPWSRYSTSRQVRPISPCLKNAAIRNQAQGVYESCVKNYHTWKSDQNRQWSHWSARYIDYFGAREFIPRGSSFI